MRIRMAARRRFDIKQPQSGSGALDDSYLPLCAVAERKQRRLIAGAVVRGNGLGHAVELDQNGTLHEALLVHLGRFAACQEAPSAGGNGWPGPALYAVSLSGSFTEL